MYWLVCLPILESDERTWTLLQNKTTYENDYSINFKFAIPELRVGTLDTLMVLSDDLVKVNALVESVVNKIRRQLFEMGSPGRDDDFQEVRPLERPLLPLHDQALKFTLLWHSPGEPSAGHILWVLTYFFFAMRQTHLIDGAHLLALLQVSVAGQRPDQYLESFSWDEAKYPPRRALNETVSAITETTQKLEDDLKVGGDNSCTLFSYPALVQSQGRQTVHFICVICPRRCG